MIIKFARLSLLNLFIVSLLGVTLRYKAVFSLPFIDYKNLLNAHSHFAFSGWVTTALFTSFVYMLSASGKPLSIVYKYQFRLSQMSSFGMLISFSIQGYGPVSILFSSLSVVFSWWFAIQFLHDIRKTDWPPVIKNAIRLSFVFLILSAAGPFLLAWCKTHPDSSGPALYHNAIYLYLHFQYNGWFTFGVMALFFWSVRHQLQHGPQRLANIFIALMGLACIPAYGLSLLWMAPPEWVRQIAGAAALLQLGALAILFFLPLRPKGLWLFAFLAFSIKLVLQALSAIPALGNFAFGYRPLVIAYLHLVVLGCITFALLAFFLANGLTAATPFGVRLGLTTFVSGVIANELVLFGQSLLAFFAKGWPSSAWWLLGAAILMSGGLAFFIYATYFSVKVNRSSI